MTRPCESCGHVNPAAAGFCGECGARTGESRADPAIGAVLLGRYRLIRVIGEGAMGRVYEAEQQMGATTRRVAVKALHAVLARDATLAERFRRECGVVIKLEHPNTIRFLDFGDLPDGRSAIVMEYVDGETLDDRLARGPLALELVYRIVHQVSGALHEAHERGIVHRDLKPDNVMLTERAGESDVVKVCDFGIAKVEVEDQEQLTQQGAVLGTPQYMSPEQFMGSALDARSDVYSLAVMVYEMLTGALPFEAGNVFQWAQRHLRADPIPMEAHPAGAMVPEAPRRAVMRALSKDPAMRPASVIDFARELTGAAEIPSGFGMRQPAVEKPVEVTKEMSFSEESLPGAPGSPRVATALGHAPLEPSVPRTREHAPVKRPTPPRARGRGVLVFVVMFAIGVIGVGAGVYFWMEDGSGGETTALAEPGPAESAPTENPSAPTEWLRVVRSQQSVAHPFNAIGAADGRFAVIDPGGTITLELAGSAAVVSDGGPGPDLHVVVDASRSGTYRVAAGASPRALTPVAGARTGTGSFDIDPHRLRTVRHVRISAGDDHAVWLDAVGCYRQSE